MLKLFGILFGWMLATTVMAAGQFTLKSSAFPEKGSIPILYTCDGKNTSPPLSWENPPAGTQYYLLVLSNPDWITINIDLWVLFNIPATIKSLALGADTDLPADINTGNNYYDETDYRGPCPLDKNAHDYVFTLYALDTKIDLEDSAQYDDVMHAIKHHILGTAVLTGVYRHPLKQALNIPRYQPYHSKWISH